MTIESAFNELQRGLREFEEALDALGTTVEQDKPAGDDVIVASRLNDAVLAARGYLEESLIAAAAACGAVVHPFDADRARLALVRCQERFHRFANCFADEIASYECWDDLTSIRQRRGREWVGWVSVIQDALRHCRGLIEDIRGKLFLCWQELAERTNAGSVSVINTQVGQRVAVGNLPAAASLDRSEA